MSTTTTPRPYIPPKSYMDHGVEFTDKLKSIFRNIRLVAKEISLTFVIALGIIFTYQKYVEINELVRPNPNKNFREGVEVAPALESYEAVYRTYLYIAQEGDQVNDIAKEHQMSPDQIFYLNPHLTHHPNNIQTNKTEIRVRAQAQYIVKEGDTIDKIIASYFLTKEELMRANKKNFIEVGETLIIPFHVRACAKKFRLYDK